MELVLEGSLAEIRAQMRDFLGQDVETVKEPAKKAEKKAAAPAETKAEEKPAVPAAVTVEDCRKAITDMLAVETIGKPGVIKLFTDHFAYAGNKASALKPEDYASFVSKAKALIG